MANEKVALRKREQIQNSNRSMFLWVTIAAALVSIAAVGAWFMAQQIIFKAKVIGEKQSTVKTLEKNNKNIVTLADEVRALDANASLESVKANPDDRAVQVVLDALPADANSLALGSSLQNKLVSGIDGLTVESISVTPVSDVEQTITSGESSNSEPTESGQVQFTVVLSANDPNPLKAAMTRFEKSIRVIAIDDMRVDRTDQQYLLTIKAHSYYEAGQKVQLGTKVVKP